MLIIADTCFWIGLCDRTDSYHLESRSIWEKIQDKPLILPWPVMYETLKTKSVKQKPTIDVFQNIVHKNKGITLMDDSPYRDLALEELFLWVQKNRPLSLTDIVIRNILQDKINIDTLISFNEKDFVDVCRRRKPQINLISYAQASGH